MAPGTVAVVGTWDTKGEELAFVAERVRSAGGQTHVIDVGVFEPRGPSEAIHTTADEVAQLGGSTLDELRRGGEGGQARALALEAMTRGLTVVLQRLFAQGTYQAVLGVGGSSGTTVVTAAIRALPAGVPKLVVSTMASGDVSPYVDTRDLCLMYSIVDIAGLNRISRQVLDNAAHAAAGMAQPRSPLARQEQRSLVAISMFGVTTPCVQQLQQLLDQRGFETAVFHATGAGGRAMEDLITDGHVQGVVDVTTSELTDELVGGVLSAGPLRLEAAGRCGIPQVVVPGALEVINWGPEHTVPDSHRVPERRMHVHNLTVTVTRTNRDESQQLGRIVTDKLAGAQGPLIVALPLHGLSALDIAGGPYEDPEADIALFDELRRGLADRTEIREIAAHINDAAFAEALAAAFDTVWDWTGVTKP